MGREFVVYLNTFDVT